MNQVRRKLQKPLDPIKSSFLDLEKVHRPTVAGYKKPSVEYVLVLKFAIVHTTLSSLQPLFEPSFKKQYSSLISVATGVALRFEH